MRYFSTNSFLFQGLRQSPHLLLPTRKKWNAKLRRFSSRLRRNCSPDFLTMAWTSLRVFSNESLSKILPQKFVVFLTVQMLFSLHIYYQILHRHSTLNAQFLVFFFVFFVFFFFGVEWLHFPINTDCCTISLFLVLFPCSVFDQTDLRQRRWNY